MTRRLTPLVLLISGLLPISGTAQDHLVPHASYAPGYQPAINQCPPEYGNNVVTPDSPLYAQLYPKDRLDLFRRNDSEMADLLGATIRKSWVRFDYLYWDISGANDTLLGAQVLPDPVTGPYDLSGVDRSRRLNAQDRTTGLRPFTTAVVPSIGQSEQGGLNGFRGNMGIPLAIGDLEASIWVLEEFEEVDTVVPFNDMVIPGIDNFLIGATTLLDNGQLSDSTMILYSENYRASISTDLWGTEVNIVNHPFTPNVGIEVSPILGIQYLNLDEQLLIAGQDMPNPTTVLNHRIQSNTKNQVFGPQVGLRFVSKMKRLTFQTDAKFLFGINRIENRLITQQIFSVNELPTFARDDRTRFAPTFDLSVSAKCQATHHLSFYIAYKLLVGGGYSRAYDNVFYNASGSLNAPPAIALQDATDNFYVHGLVLGGEIVFH